VSVEASSPKLAFTPVRSRSTVRGSMPTWLAVASPWRGREATEGGGVPPKGIDADLARDRVPVAGREVHRDRGDLPEEVQVRRELRDGPVEEHQVLDEEHQLL